MMRTWRSPAIAALVGIPWLAAPAESAAQGASPQECRAAEAALAAGDRDPVAWQVLPECGRSGADALAEALAGAGSEPGGTYLQILGNLAGMVQAPSILDAAESLARDGGATPAARTAGLLTLLGQYDAGIYFPISVSWDELTSVPRTGCRLLPLTGSRWEDTHPMPADYVERIRSVMEDLADDADPVVSAMATCLGSWIR